jgi:hypothetical protein
MKNTLGMDNTGTAQLQDGLVTALTHALEKPTSISRQEEVSQMKKAQLEVVGRSGKPLPFPPTVSSQSLPVCGPITHNYTPSLAVMEAKDQTREVSFIALFRVTFLVLACAPSGVKQTN